MFIFLEKDNLIRDPFTILGKISRSRRLFKNPIHCIINKKKLRINWSDLELLIAEFRKASYYYEKDWACEGTQNSIFQSGISHKHAVSGHCFSGSTQNVRETFGTINVPWQTFTGTTYTKELSLSYNYLFQITSENLELVWIIKDYRLSWMYNTSRPSLSQMWYITKPSNCKLLLKSPSLETLWWIIIWIHSVKATTLTLSSAK